MAKMRMFTRANFALDFMKESLEKAIEFSVFGPIEFKFCGHEINVPENEITPRRLNEVYKLCQAIEKNTTAFGHASAFFGLMPNKSYAYMISVGAKMLKSATRKNREVIEELKNFPTVREASKKTNWTKAIEFSLESGVPPDDFNKYQLGALIVFYILEAVFNTGKVREDFKDLVKKFEDMDYPKDFGNTLGETYPGYSWQFKSEQSELEYIIMGMTTMSIPRKRI